MVDTGWLESNLQVDCLGLSDMSVSGGSMVQEVLQSIDKAEAETEELGVKKKMGEGMLLV